MRFYLGITFRELLQNIKINTNRGCKVMLSCVMTSSNIPEFSCLPICFNMACETSMLLLLCYYAPHFSILLGRKICYLSRVINLFPSTKRRKKLNYTFKLDIQHIKNLTMEVVREFREINIS